MLSPTKNTVRFGPFELDLNVWQLRKDGARVKIPQQPLQLLAMLLERPGLVFSREELCQRLWPSDVIVDFEHGLNKNIQRLREALSDYSGFPRYIETIPRIGYRFIGAGIEQPEALASKPETNGSPTTATLPAGLTTPPRISGPGLFWAFAGCLAVILVLQSGGLKGDRTRCRFALSP
jgi:DNA-binding winged helix-turn-helix (wHTH) protein